MKKKGLFIALDVCVTLFLLFGTSIKSYSQCTANAGNDVTICSGGSATIGTSATSGYTYSWSPTTGLSNPNIAQPNASPNSTTTYTLTQIGTNLISNPGFENGNTGFSSDYTYCTGSSCTSGSYNVAGSVIVVGHCTTSPHSGSKMYYGFPPSSNPSNFRAWYTTINVTSNTIYKVSGFIARMANVAIEFDVILIGNNSGTSSQSFRTSAGCGVWNQFAVDWTSSSSDTQVTLEIRVTNSGSTVLFALDDFSLGCKSTDEVTVNVAGSTPSVTPAGPITYFNQYETPNSIVLTSTLAPSYQWYKNDNAIGGATNQTYTINFNGNSTYTDYYKCITSCGTSNTVTFNYVGCDNRADYPVSIPTTQCASNFPLTLTQQNLGAGTTYTWWTYSTPSFYSFSNFSGNSCQLNIAGNCGLSECGDWIYTKADKNGEQVYMFFGDLGATSGCRPGPGSGHTKLPQKYEKPIIQAKPGSVITKLSEVQTPAITKSPIIQKPGLTRPPVVSDPANKRITVVHEQGVTKIFLEPEQKIAKTLMAPNPANTEVTISSKNIMQRIEVYNSTGVLVKAITVNGNKSIIVKTSDLNAGYYTCKVISNKRTVTLKLAVQR